MEQLSTKTGNYARTEKEIIDENNEFSPWMLVKKKRRKKQGFNANYGRNDNFHAQNVDKNSQRNKVACAIMETKEINNILTINVESSSCQLHVDMGLKYNGSTTSKRKKLDFLSSKIDFFPQICKKVNFTFFIFINSKVKKLF